MPRRPPDLIAPPATLRVVGAAIVADRRCLAALRGPEMSSPGVWELPGGKVEPGETPRGALVREIREELGIEIEVGELLGRGSSEADGLRIELEVYLARRVSGHLRLGEHAGTRWLTADELGDLDWASADRPVLEPLAAFLRSS